MSQYESLIDRLMQFFTTEAYAEDVQQAKAEFFEGTGFLDEEQRDDFEMKMNQFGEWYLFQRPLNAYQQTPAVACFELSDFTMAEDEIRFFKNLKATRKSLFEFIKFSKDDLVIRDLFSDYKMTLKGNPIKYGFNKGDIFEGRLVPHEDSFCFTRSFCFHPDEAKKFILKNVKKIRKFPAERQAAEREKIIFKLYKMKNKYEQYPHVSVDKIYTETEG